MVMQDGFTLYESRAICKYLTMKYSFPLLPAPTDLEAGALVEQAQSVEMSYFAEPVAKIQFERTVKKFMGLPADEAAVSSALKALEAYLDIAEKLLSEKEYMAGKEYTLVDVFYVPLIERLIAGNFGEIISSRKNVNAWWQRCSSRSAVKSIYKDL